MRLLIKHGAQVHGDHGHFSPLGGAAIRGNVAIMRAILAQGADPNKPVMSKEDAAWDVTPLMIAIAEAHTACAELLLRNGANPNVVCRDLASGFSYRSVEADWHKHQGEGPPCTPLILAETTCNAAAIKVLRKFGALAHPPGTRGKEAALFHSPIGLRGRTLNPLPKVVRLIRERASFEAIRRAVIRVRDLDEDSGKLLETACWGQRSDVVRHLLGLGANPNYISWHTLAESAGGSTAIARLLLDHGYDLTNERCKYQVPIIEAARCGEVRLIRLLLARGVDVNISPEYDLYGNGLTPLMTAIFHDQLRCAALLLEKGADPDQGCGHFPEPQNSSHLLPLLSQRGWGSLFPVDLPYNLGDPCKSVAMPLHLAVLTASLKAVSLLMWYGASPDAAEGLDHYVEHVPLRLESRLKALLQQPVRPRFREPPFG